MVTEVLIPWTLGFIVGYLIGKDKIK